MVFYVLGGCIFYMKRVYINNAEYNLIFNSFGVDTDKLCSVFIFLRGSKNGERRYNPIGKLKHFGLLKSKTTLSRHAIETYVPKLIELGLITLNSDGGVSVISTTRSFRLFGGNCSRQILIPIQMCQSYIKTSIQVGFVRVKTNIKNQKKQIDKKETQKQLLKKYVYQSKNMHLNILSKKEMKACEKIIARFGSVNEFLSMYCEETILSQQGFANLNKNVDGRYFKKQLVGNGFIETQIRTETLISNISYKKYLSLKEVIISSHGKGIYWCINKRSVEKYISSGIKERVFLSSGEFSAS